MRRFSLNLNDYRISVPVSTHFAQQTDDRRGEIYGEDGEPVLWPEGRDLECTDTAGWHYAADGNQGTPEAEETVAQMQWRVASIVARIEAHDAYCARIYRQDERRTAVRAEIRSIENCYDTYYVADRERLAGLRRELRHLDAALVNPDTFGWPIPSFIEF